MVTCSSCQTDNPIEAKFCENCGTSLALPQPEFTDAPEPPQVEPLAATVEPPADFGMQTIVAGAPKAPEVDEALARSVKAYLVIERGDHIGVNFSLTEKESLIGRWDADNGIFPEIDFDRYDPEAKVSRRHAKLYLRDGQFVVEDLGSTNGTFINRGRRLLPGVPQVLVNDDELIVGKTFLRFKVVS